MNLFWVFLLLIVPSLVVLFMVGICRCAGIADDAMDRLRANNYQGKVPLYPSKNR